jgi:hypothetical protein
MKLHKILSLILVAALAITVGLVGCSPQPTSGGGSGGGAGGGGEAVDKITIIFNFEGTLLPEDYGVIPFVVGGFNSINSDKYYEWAKVTNGGIKQDGTGSQLMTKINRKEYKFEILTSDILLDPDTPTGVQFKAANYNPAGWDNVVNNFWDTVGKQLSDDEKIVISNNQIIAAYKPGSTEPVLPGESRDGIELSADGKTIKIKVAEHGGWTVHLAYTVNNVQLTLVVSNVVTTNQSGNPLGAYGFSGNFNNWGDPPAPATILSTNDDDTVNIIGTITYTGNPTVQYKVRGSNTSGNWEWGPPGFGGDRSFIIPPVPSGSRYTNYDPGPIDRIGP